MEQSNISFPALRLAGLICHCHQERGAQQEGSTTRKYVADNCHQVLFYHMVLPHLLVAIKSEKDICNQCISVLDVVPTMSSFSQQFHHQQHHMGLCCSYKLKLLLNISKIYYSPCLLQ